MRKTLLSCLSLLLLAGCAQGYISKTATHPAMAPSGLPEITALHITENAKSVTADKAKLCKSFRITQAQALSYFGAARIVASAPAAASICSARGELTFAFEGPAKWAIGKDGYATLTKQNGTTLDLFCPDCILDNLH